MALFNPCLVAPVIVLCEILLLLLLLLVPAPAAAAPAAAPAPGLPRTPGRQRRLEVPAPAPAPSSSVSSSPHVRASHHSREGDERLSPRVHASHAAGGRAVWNRRRVSAVTPTAVVGRRAPGRRTTRLAALLQHTKVRGSTPGQSKRVHY